MSDWVYDFMLSTIRNKFERRPFWMNVIFVFCVYMTFIYLPWDVLIKPVSEDEEGSNKENPDTTILPETESSDSPRTYDA